MRSNLPCAIKSSLASNSAVYFKLIISEKDLELRGSGDLFGVKQSGMPDFKYGDIVTHANVLEAANRDAISLLTLDDFFSSERYLPLREYVMNEQVTAKKLQ